MSEINIHHSVPSALALCDHSGKAIYIIIDDKIGLPVYVGATRNFSTRRATHIADLKGGRHVNGAMQAWFDAQQAIEIHFRIIDLCDGVRPSQREVLWITTGRQLGWPLLNVCAGERRVSKREALKREFHSLNQRCIENPLSKLIYNRRSILIGMLYPL